MEKLQRKFSDGQITPLIGGGTNAVYLLEQDGARSVLKVAMVSNENARREAACLKLLNESMISPKLYQTFEMDNRFVIQLEFIKGQSFLDLVSRHYKAADFNSMYPLFISLGQLLSRLHNTRVDKCAYLCEIELTIPDQKNFIERSLHNQSCEFISHLAGTKGQPPVLLHGDFGYHNAIRNSSGADKIIDWELAGLGDPRIDIANVLFWMHLHFPDAAPACSKFFIDAYTDQRAIDCSPELMHGYVIFQVWRIIELVTDHFPENVKKEWNRRLSWALEHNFVSF